jgi:hypothetical protein
MGYSVVRQPDGKLALFSSVVDDFLCTDATEDEIVDVLTILEQGRMDAAVKSWREDVEKVAAGERYLGGRSYEEAVEAIERVHGIEATEEWLYTTGPIAGEHEHGS